MVREVLTIGDERLLQISQPVAKEEFGTKELNDLITDMYDTMQYKNGVGIAAIQIGYLKRVILIGYDGNNPRYKSIGDCPLTVIINPQIEVIGDKVCERDEGCLSVPGMRGTVSRAEHIRYKFYNQSGELIEGESDGFFARAMQHETDHLNGVLFPSRITDPSTFHKIS